MKQVNADLMKNNKKIFGFLYIMYFQSKSRSHPYMKGKVSWEIWITEHAIMKKSI